jgi:hypothetical protein
MGYQPPTFALSKRNRTTGLTIQTTMTMPTSQEALILRTCTIRQSVSLMYSTAVTCRPYCAPTAKKEDSPEEALKDFRAIVEQEEEKGDWYVYTEPVARDASESHAGVSRR